MFCKNCGNQVPDGSAYCAKCGASMRNDPVADYDNPGSGGYNYPGSNRYNNPGSGGYNNPGSRGYNYPGSGGYNYPGSGGYNNPGSGGYNNPGSGGYNNPGMRGNTYYSNNSYGNGRLSVDPNAALMTLTSKLRTSATIWTLVGIYQIIMGVFLLIIGYGLLSLGLGIWNIIQASKSRRNADYFQANPVGIVNTFEAGKSMTIIFLFINFFFGAVFGFIGSIYDLTVDDYVLSHRDAFEALERRVTY